MIHKKLPELPDKSLLFSIGLIVNTFVWLFCTSKLLRKTIEIGGFSDADALMIWSVNFSGAAVSILAGALLTNRFHLRRRFLFCWTLFGTLSSIASLFMDATMYGALAVSALLSVSLGLGLPVCMAEFAEQTAVERRGRLGGIMLLLIMGLQLPCNAIMANLITENIATSLLFLAIWRGLGLITFLPINPHERNVRTEDSVSFASIIGQRSFVLYAIPWTMFSLVNYLSAPIGAKIHGDDFENLMMIGNAFAGVSAIVGGFLCDVIGRKRITIVGFIILGLGYAVVGVSPASYDSWCFHTLVDGIAWGMLYVIFITTLWGDLAYGKRSEKYYALGSLPYLLSSFLRLTAGPLIADTVSYTAVFSFASFFLFLAVLPLMYAPETLPEKKMKERELKIYVERAKKIREEYH